MQQTTREILEQEFAKHNGETVNDEGAKVETTTVVMADEGFDEAPVAYVGEIRNSFHGLPFEVRKYICEREGEIEKTISQMKEELNAKHFIDDAFDSKGSKRGFKTARDWIEHLILAEDLIEQKPAEVLQFLGKVYGIDIGMGHDEAKVLQVCVGNSAKADALMQDIRRLFAEVSALRLGFEAKAKNDAEILAKAEEAKAAKEAAFNVSGHRKSDDEYKELTTREMLERQFAQLNND